MVAHPEVAEMPEEYAELPSPPITNVYSDDTASIIEKIDPAIIAERIKHQLLGEEYEQKSDTWKSVKDRKPYVNDAGADKLCSMFSSVVNSNASMTNLTDKEINRIMVSFGDALIDLITFKYEEFDIKVDEAEAIKEIIINNAFFCLKRSYQQGERKFLGKAYKETGRSGYIPEPQSRGRFLGRLRI